MTNELLEVEDSCAIFTHIITVSVADCAGVGVWGGYSTIHTSSRKGGREGEGASDAVSDLIPSTDPGTV